MRERLLSIAKRFLGEDRGAVLVEMTLITPLMIALSAGVFEFGNLIHNKLLIEAGLRDAARYAARCNPKMYSDFGLTIDCKTNAENIALYGYITSTDGGVSRPPRVAGWTVVDVAIAEAADCHDAVVGGATKYRSVTAQVCIVKATGTLNYEGSGLLAYLGLSPITLNGLHEERLIRF